MSHYVLSYKKTPNSTHDLRQLRGRINRGQLNGLWATRQVAGCVQVIDTYFESFNATRAQALAAGAVLLGSTSVAIVIVSEVLPLGVLE